MSLKIKRKKAEASVKAGTYIAICTVVADPGEQYSDKFKSYSPKLHLGFDIPSERIMIDGVDKPCRVSKDYTASINSKSAFFTMITSWQGKTLSDEEKQEFDASALLGKGCMVSVTVDETESGTYNRIASVVGLPAGIETPKAENDLILFDWDTFTEDGFNALPEWLKDKIKKSTEYQQRYAVDEQLDMPDKDSAAVDLGF